MYPRKVVESIAEQMKTLAAERKLLVTKGTPSFGPGPNLLDTVALVTEVDLDDQGIEVEIEILPLPAHEAVVALMEQGMGSFTPVAEGTVTRDKEKGVDVVEDVTFQHLSFGPKLPDPPTT